MSHTQVIIAFIILLTFGLALSANNLTHSIIVNIFLYNDSLSNNLTRIQGLILVLSSILLVLGAYNICIVLILFVLISFIFLIIRGKHKSKDAKEKKKQELIDLHMSEVDAKMRKLEQLRERMENNQANTSKSISSIKKSRWDDGRPTSKEMIEEFNK